MRTGNGQIAELILADGSRYARLSCPENLVPAPGQYLLASSGSDALLAVPIFYTDSAPQGFISTAHEEWRPGDTLFLRGPLGRGFALPLSARKVGLIAYDDSPARLRGLIQLALKQEASVAVVCDLASEDLPDDVEIQPLAVLDEILQWADYLAFDIEREKLPELAERLEKRSQLPAVKDAQVLVRTQMPCGGIAECGVCAVVTKSSWMMACKDGPVFDWREISSTHARG